MPDRCCPYNSQLELIKHRMPMMIFRISSLFCAILLASFVCSASAGEDRRHHKLGLDIAAEVTQRLVEEKICDSLNDCNRMSRVLFASNSKGLNIEIYGVVDSGAVGRVSDVLIRRAKELPAGAYMKAEFLELSKSQDLQRTPLSSRKVFAEIIVRGQYVAR